MRQFNKSIVATSLAILYCIPTYAEDTTEEKIEQITVTAQKRSQRIIDVPVSVAAMTGESIETAGIQQLSELGDYIPNVNINSGDSLESSVQIRGVGADSRNIGFDTRVGVYIDGIYMGQSPAINQDLVDLERVEVLRGPQGALFGKNTVAGAVNLISKKPTDELEGQLKARIGNFNALQLSGRVNVPLTDNAFLNLSASNIKRDGYVKNTTTGEDLNNRNSEAYRAQLLVEASDNLSVLATFDAQSVDQTPAFAEGLSDPFGVILLKPKANNEVNNNHSPTDVRDVWGISLDIDYTFNNDFTLRSISSYRDTDSDFSFDIDYSPLELLIADYKDKYEQTTQEFQLISPAQDRFDYLIGLYYYNQKSETQRNAIVGDDITDYVTAILGPLPPEYYPSEQVTNEGTVETESYAIFANFNYDITEQLHLGFGFRYSEETKEVNWNLDGSTSGLFAIGVGQVEDSRTDKDFSPSVSLNYDFNDNLVGYLRYAEGYKSGGYNLDYVTQADLEVGVEFDKETVASYEVGLKGLVLDGQLQFAFAVFDTNYDDYQVNQFIDLGDGFTSISIRNAAEVSTTGAELELTTQATESLSMSASLGVLDAKFDSFVGGGAGGSDASGNKIPRAAEFQGALALDYFHTISDSLELMVHAGYTYTGGSFTTVDNLREVTTPGDNQTTDWGYMPSKGLLDVRITLGDADDIWSVALWSRNALDKDYDAGTSRDFLGTLTGLRGTPRMYGLEVKYNF
jgi:iron complex outermembrane receptor protein